MKRNLCAQRQYSSEFYILSASSMKKPCLTWLLSKTGQWLTRPITGHNSKAMFMFLFGGGRDCQCFSWFPLCPLLHMMVVAKQTPKQRHSTRQQHVQEPTDCLPSSLPTQSPSFDNDHVHNPIDSPTCLVYYLHYNDAIIHQPTSFPLAFAFEATSG